MFFRFSETPDNRLFLSGGTQRTGLGVVGGFEKRPPGTEAQLKN
jgi:hypothetical protein